MKTFNVWVTYDGDSVATKLKAVKKTPNTVTLLMPDGSTKTRRLNGYCRVHHMTERDALEFLVNDHERCLQQKQFEVREHRAAIKELNAKLAKLETK